MVGTYKATVIDHVLAESKNGTPSIKFKLQLTENVLTGDPVNAIVFFDAWLSEKAFENSMLTVTDALDWQGVDLNDFNGTGKFNGVPVSVLLDEEEYQGEKRTKVKFMNNVNRVAKVAALDIGKAQGLAQKLKDKALAYRQQNKPQAGKPVDDFNGRF